MGAGRSDGLLWVSGAGGGLAGEPPGVAINRTQWLVLGFFLAVWVGVITILAMSPQVYRPGLARAPGSLRVGKSCSWLRSRA